MLRKTIYQLVFLIVLAAILGISAVAQQNAPVIVRPGAPGQPTTVLPPDTTPTLSPLSAEDIEFMQGMIHHHAQAVEMVELMNERTTNKPLLLLGARIRQSQSDEMNFMKRWLAVRGQPTEMNMSGMSGGHHHGHHGSGQHEMMMPGMLTAEQMKELKAARGADFDRSFLKGMIQHHTGALVMVKELFDAAGTGQDAEIFNFATDVDSGQRAEIKIMQTMLEEKPKEK